MHTSTRSLIAVLAGVAMLSVTTIAQADTAPTPPKAPTPPSLGQELKGSASDLGNWIIGKDAAGTPTNRGQLIMDSIGGTLGLSAGITAAGVGVAILTGSALVAAAPVALGLAVVGAGLATVAVGLHFAFHAFRGYTTTVAQNTPGAGGAGSGHPGGGTPVPTTGNNGGQRQPPPPTSGGTGGPTHGPGVPVPVIPPVAPHPSGAPVAGAGPVNGAGTVAKPGDPTRTSPNPAPGTHLPLPGGVSDGSNSNVPVVATPRNLPPVVSSSHSGSHWPAILATTALVAGMFLSALLNKQGSRRVVGSVGQPGLPGSGVPIPPRVPMPGAPGGRVGVPVVRTGRDGGSGSNITRGAASAWHPVAESSLSDVATRAAIRRGGAILQP